MQRTLALGLVIVCTLYCAFGGFSYMMFGSHTDRLITKNFPDGAFKVGARAGEGRGKAEPWEGRGATLSGETG